MAPEMIINQNYDFRIDIWCLGVLLYELLTGIAPFSGKTFEEASLSIKKKNIEWTDKISLVQKDLISGLM